MGIHNSKTTWFAETNKNRTEEQERLKKGMRPRFTPPKVCVGNGNVKTSPQAEAFILAHCSPRDEEGRQTPSTERGRRRHNKRLQEK